MPTIVATGGKAAGIPYDGINKTYVVRNIIDLKTLNPVTNDVVQALGIKAGTFVHRVKVRIIRPAVGTSGSATVGDGTAAAGWDTTIDLKAAAGTFTGPGTLLLEAAPNTFADLFALGKFYAVADTIDLVTTLHADLTDKGSVEVIAICTDLN